MASQLAECYAATAAQLPMRLAEVENRVQATAQTTADVVKVCLMNSECLRVCVYVCLHVYVCVCVRARVRTRVRARAYVGLCARVYACMRVRGGARALTCTSRRA
jgi:hypothetical protein